MDEIPDLDPAPYLKITDTFNTEFDEVFKLPELDSLLVSNPLWRDTSLTPKRISIQDYLMTERKTAQHLHSSIVSTLLDVGSFIMTYERLLERASSVNRPLRVAITTLYENNQGSIVPIFDGMNDLSNQCGMTSSYLKLFLRIIERATQEERKTARFLKRLKISVGASAALMTGLTFLCTRFGNKVLSQLAKLQYFREIVAMGSYHYPLPTLGILFAATFKSFQLLAADETVASPRAETLEAVQRWADEISGYLNKIHSNITLMARLLRDIHTLSVNCSDPQLYDIILFRKLKDKVSTLKTLCIEALESLEARSETKADGSE